jgi:hypothetical protein
MVTKTRQNITLYVNILPSGKIHQSNVPQQYAVITYRTKIGKASYSEYRVKHGEKWKICSET